MECQRWVLYIIVGFTGCYKQKKREQQVPRAPEAPPLTSLHFKHCTMKGVESVDTEIHPEYREGQFYTCWGGRSIAYEDPAI